MDQEQDTARMGAPAAVLAPVRDLRRVLQAQVANVMRCTMPELRGVAAAAAYDHVMDDPRLLHRAFRHFRSRPDLFAAFVKDAAGAAVADDDTPLHCGRSLRDVIRLVIRASAKRYFRRHFLAALYGGVFGRIRLGLHLWFGLGEDGRRRARRKAALHFQAIGQHLQYEWQARLIPVYATLPTATLERLGPELLRHRDPAALHRAASTAGAPRAATRQTPQAAPKPRRLVAGRSRHLGDHGREIERAVASEAMGKLLGALDDHARQALAQEVAAVPDTVFRALLAEGLSPAESVVFLFIAAHALDRVAFAELFLGDRGAQRAQELTRRLAAGSARARLSAVADTVMRAA